MDIFCFFIGILYTYTHHYFLLIALICLFYLSLRYQTLIFFFLGLLIASLHQYSVLPKGMPDEGLIRYATLTGRIASIPNVSTDKTQFLFLIDHINGKKADALVQLAWYQNAPELHTGEHWQLSAQLKKPRNFQNPGSYDYVTTLKTKHISFSGYVQRGSNQRLSPATADFDWLKLRDHLGHKLNQLAPEKKTAGVVEALTLNMTRHISQEDWSLFRRTGTIHLFGISGEHVALLSGLFFFIIRKLWSQSAYCCLRIPAQSVASAAGLIVALLYAFLAGFEPPVQRALIGCFLYTLAYLGAQRFTPWQVWRYALFGVLCIEPHAVFMQGFYFSFLAVTCLLLTQQRWAFKGYKNHLALQLSCLIGLMPLTLFWFSYGSLNGFIANLFAIPLVGLLIVPLALVTMLFSSFDWSWLLMKPLSWLVGLLFKGLEWTEHLAAININWPLPSVELLLPLLGALLMWVLLPIRPFKYLALLWLIIPLFPARTEIQSGEARVQVLDVGQGLAVHIQTKNHVLLYDTGDQFHQGGDLGQMVILPFYQTLGVKQIDALVISHPDRDHLGGFKSIDAVLPIKKLLVNDPTFYKRGLNCHEYPQWTWDKVHFRFFPIKTAFKSKNNNCCVLQVSTASGSVLLPGDIEKEAEDYLVRTYGAALKSDVLIVPHHASKTSSSYRFLLETAPKYAIASLGFANRFHFPHEQILSKMSALNIAFFRTDECGMSEIKLANHGVVEPPQCNLKGMLIG